MRMADSVDSCELWAGTSVVLEDLLLLLHPEALEYRTFLCGEASGIEIYRLVHGAHVQSRIRSE